jgi:hypothetical protein
MVSHLSVLVPCETLAHVLTSEKVYEFRLRNNRRVYSFINAISIFLYINLFTSINIALLP